MERGNQVDILLNGPASFTKRKELIDNAQEVDLYLLVGFL